MYTTRCLCMSELRMPQVQKALQIQGQRACFPVKSVDLYIGPHVSTTVGPIYVYVHTWTRRRTTAVAQEHDSGRDDFAGHATPFGLNCWRLFAGQVRYARCNSLLNFVWLQLCVSLILRWLLTEHTTNGDQWHVTDTYALIWFTRLIRNCRSKLYSWVTISTLISN